MMLSNDDTDHDYVNSDFVTCFSEDMVINTINLNNINIDDDSFDDNNLYLSITYDL